MAPYTADQKETLAALLEDGVLVVLTREVRGAYDPATSSASAAVLTQTLAGLLLPLDPGERNGDSVLVKTNEQQLLLSALTSDGGPLTFAPSPGDLVAIADLPAYTLSSVAALRPNGTPIYYDCKVGGA